MYLRAMGDDAELRSPEESPLLAASRAEFPTPLDRFGASRHVYGRVHQAGGGVYLLVAPRLGPSDPSPRWAGRAMTIGQSRSGALTVAATANDCDEVEPASNAPSLASLGWPHPLSYADTLAQAARLSGRPVMVRSVYRMTDGGFTSHVIRAAARVEFHYDDPNPQPGDIAAAIELGLVGDRWERHLAEIRAINRENQARDRQ